MMYVLLTSGVVSARYDTYVLEGTQCTHGWKREIHLGYGAAIFIFNESSPSIYNILKQHDIKCHLKLESAGHDYGFHFYIEEINLSIC